LVFRRLVVFVGHFTPEAAPALVTSATIDQAQVFKFRVRVYAGIGINPYPEPGPATMTEINGDGTFAISEWLALEKGIG
jgi:hypothetical protein